MVASSTSLFFGSTAIVAPAKANSSCKSRNAQAQPQVLCLGVSKNDEGIKKGWREAVKLAAVLLLGGGLAQLASANKAKAGLDEDLLAKSAANKELNDRKRLANTARAYTVTFGTCKFPENFTGCQDLAKKKNVPFLTDDLKLERV
ncbi:hypothetical protein L7F22_054492 [Adiantum nelumboides]|nr:hypothetical protein [Adiantum nelumboides]